MNEVVILENQNERDLLFQVRMPLVLLFQIKARKNWFVTMLFLENCLYWNTG